MKNLQEKISTLSPERQELLRRKLAGASGAKPMRVPIRPDPTSLPLSFGQEGFLFLEQMRPGASQNNIPSALYLYGKIDVKALMKSFQTLFTRHQILCVRFKVKDSVPTQTLDLNNLPSIVFKDFSANGSMQDSELLKRIRKTTLQPFDLSSGHLIRAELWRLSDEKYVLVVTLHHIIADAWSVGVIVDEVLRHYSHYSTGRQQQKIETLPIQYFDFAHWQRETASQRFEAQIEYWRNKLSGATPYLHLPIDRPRRQVQSFNGAHIPFSLSKTTTDALLALSRKFGVTLFMTLLAAFNVLLYRLSGQKDISVGSPLANRDIPGTEKLVGLFINTVVMRTDFDGDPIFTDLLSRLKETTLSAFSNKDVPIEKLVEALHPKRKLSHNPFFQVLFDFHNAPKLSIDYPGLSIEPIEIESDNVKFDVVLSLELTENGLRGVWGYSTDLYDHSTSERFIGYFKSLVNSIAVHSEQKISSIPIIDEGERALLLQKWSCVESKVAVEFQPVHQFFERRAQELPDAVAAIFKSIHSSEVEKVSYRELNGRANKLAYYLMAQGVGPESCVGLCIDRSLDMLASLLAILKAGGAYLPIDPKYPRERIDFIIKDAGASFVLTHRRYRDRFQGEVICLDDDAEIISQQSSENTAVDIDPDQLAYLIYTSGSTGLPKAVMIPHSALTNHAVRSVEHLGLQRKDRVLQYITLTFDAAGEEIFPALISGAALVLPDAASELTPNDIYDLCRRQEISILHLPAAVWHALMDFMAERQLRLPENVRALLVGGESPSVEKYKMLMKRPSSAPVFYNLYGPTETTITALLKRLDSSETEFPFEQIAVGRPLPGVTVYLLDEHLNPAPKGVKGELYIGGAGVARGYLGHPELTAEKFIPDPYSGVPGARLYRTGDMVRFLPSGDLLFLGRKDFQVKIRGFRIELEEIERLLANYEHVMQAVVISVKDKTGQNQLAVYIVLEKGVDLDASALRHYLKAKLPDYMIPAHFLFLDALPLTSSGKIDRKALPAFERAERSGEKEHVSPRNKLEKYLHSLFSQTLGIERISVNDDFFELGGSSIQGATLVNRLQDDIGEYMYIVAIYDAPTIASLADYLISNYPDGVAKLTGEAVVRDESSVKLDDSNVRHLQSIVKTPPPLHLNGMKNPRAVFVLSAPRSGSTLLRAMLGGHPKLFAPPELQLLNYNRMGDRKQQLAGRDAFWLDGVVRAVMELKNCDADEARSFVAGLEEKNIGVKDFYKVMQDELGDSLFVDKTPNYALGKEILQRAEGFFQNALFVHLIRHPYGVIPSFEKAKLHVFYPPFFTEAHHYSVRQLAELVWVISHRNILDFLSTIPDDRQFRIRYEDLVTRPEERMQELCDFLGVGFHPEVLEPQNDGKKRMTDALNNLSKMLGDVRFHEHKGISAAGAWRWKEKLTQDYLGDITWDMAESFGYERLRAADLTRREQQKVEMIQPVSRDKELPLSFNQQRLWFLDHLEPNSPFYNMHSAVQIAGKVDAPLLERAINKTVERHEALRTIFKTQDGKPQQVIRSQLHIPLQRHNLQELPSDEQERRVQEFARREAAQPFDLSKGPLLRTVLLNLSPQKNIFLLTMHHIICDGWSMELFVNQVIGVYTALAGNEPMPFEALPIQYADFAHWQRRIFETEAIKDQVEYWKTKLADVPAMLELPTDRPRPAVQSYHGSKKFFDLPDDLSVRVVRFAREKRTTPFVTLLAAFYTLLHRYSDQDVICIGTPVAGRNRKELEALIGFFVNTLTLKVDLADAISFSDLVDRVQNTVKEALAHQDVPFEQLLNALDVERNTSFSPLFQVMFSHQKAPQKALAQTDLTFESLQVDSGTAKFDLTLSVTEDNDSFRAMLEYNTDLFDAETIGRIIVHYENILQNVLAEPDINIASVSFLTGSEKAAFYGERRGEQQSDPDECFHELFEEQVLRRPDAIAAVYEQSELSYAALNQRANQLAHYLKKMNVGPESLVGVCLPRSLQMLVALLAVMKAGAAYVPLDPAYPRERLSFILKDASCAAVITDGERVDRGLFRDVDVPLVDVASDKEAIGQQSRANPENKTAPDNAVYVIYTSGSTGRPKGVVVAHRSVINLYHSLRKIVYNGKSDLRVSLNAPILFDASVQQLVLLLSGSTLVIIPDDARTNIDRFIDIVQKQRIDVLDCVPSQLKLMLAQGLFDPGQWAPSMCLPGGEAIDMQTWDQLRQMNQTQFFNMYGPTECTVDSTIHAIRREDVRPTIGSPIANISVYILDQAWQPTPVGVVGEICIAGQGLARGYLNRPDLTAEKFVPNPFAVSPGGRMYRTGDLGRFRSDGSIEFLGRIDHQVKVRGYRIELGEIEARLKQHPAVSDALVLVRRQDDNSRLAAYIIAKEEEQASVADLKDDLKMALPEYMVPSLFVFMSEFPTLQNGKVDRRALPDIEVERPDLEGAFVAPRSENEKKLAAIWAELLHVKKAGVRDNFFELGGDSITSIQMISRAKQKGLLITPKDVFANPTIEGLAKVAGQSTIAFAEQGLVLGDVPLTPIQHAFFDRKIEQRHHWNQSILLETEQSIPRDMLEKVTLTLLDHHDALRMRYRKNDDGWRQYIADPDGVAPVVYIRDCGNDAKKFEAEVQHLQSFLNLQDGPLIRIGYFDMGDLPDRILIAIHHLVIDGISWRILLEDFHSIYLQVRMRQKIVLPEKTSSFKYWAEKLIEYARSEEHENELQFWLDRAKEDFLPLQVDYPDGTNYEADAIFLDAALDRESTLSFLQDTAAAVHARPNILLLTALANAFSKVNGRRKLYVQLEGHGREDIIESVDLSRTVGWFTTLCPVNLDLDDIDDPGDQLRHVDEIFHKIPNNGIGFGLFKYLSESEKVRQALEQIPKPQVSFNYLGRFEQPEFGTSNFRVQPMKNPYERSPLAERPYLIDISASIRGDVLHIRCAFSGKKFDQKRIEILLEEYIQELKRIIQYASAIGADQGFESIDIVADEDMDDILNELEI